MKNTFKLSGVAAIALAIVVSMVMLLAGCSNPANNGDDGKNPVTPNTPNTPDTPNTPNTTVTLVGIAINALPTRIQYNINEELDTSGMVIAAIYSNGTTAPVTGYTVSGYNKTTLGNQTITVTYSGKTTTFTVNVINPNLPTVAMPTASPAAGIYNTAQNVILSTATLDAKIYFTIDGINPTRASNVYTSAITINVTTTIKAIAVKDGMNDSGILTAEYTITSDPILTGTVSITGDAEVNQILRAHTASLGGSGTISYEWKRDGFVIGTDSSYIVQITDIGSTITVTVTRSGYSGSITSAPTTTVIPEIPPTLGFSFELINWGGNYGYSVSRGTVNAAEVVIPAFYNGLPVFLIADNGFSSYTNMTSIRIPDSVTRIGDEAFYGCTGLTSITIPDSVKDIYNNVFSGCTGLTSVIIRDGVTFIGFSMFEGCTSLTNITIPDSVTYIGEGAFRGCTGLASITIPNGVTRIGGYAFSGCTGLTMTSLTIPDSVMETGEGVFEGCTGLMSSLTSVTIPGNIFFSYFLFGTPGIPASLKTVIVTGRSIIGFSGCTGLTNVIISDSVTHIYATAFKDCTDLTSVTIGNGVTVIDNRAFEGCTSLTSINFNATAAMRDPDSYYNNRYGIFTGAGQNATGITVNIGANVTKIPEWLFSNTSDDFIRPKITAVNFAEGSVCQSIGSYAFYKCDSLTSVNIPNSVTEIGGGAFRDCTGLMSVTIGNSVTEIGGMAFSGCTGLASITIPNGVTEIKIRAFEGCTGLTMTSLTIPNSVEFIGEGVFKGCTGLMSSLTSITIPFVGENRTSDMPFEYLFNDYNSRGSFPASLETVIITGGNSIPARLFYFYYKKLTSVTIPNGVTEIGNEAFSYCENLTSINIPNSVKKIGNDAFRECKNLTSITIPDGVTEIGYGAFRDTGLTSITIPNSVTKIGAGALASYLTSVTMPFIVASYDTSETLNSIFGSYVPVVPPASLSLKAVNITSGNIPAYAFEDWKNLTSITIGGSVTSIGEYAFKGCESLKYVTIGSNVTSIGERAFSSYDCFDLDAVFVTFQGTIAQENFPRNAFDFYGDGMGYVDDLWSHYFAYGGGPGTYRRYPPEYYAVFTWIKQ